MLASLRGGRLDEAEQLVQQALDSSEKLGMRMVGDRIARSTGKARIRRAPAPPAAGDGVGTRSPTPSNGSLAI